MKDINGGAMMTNWFGIRIENEFDSLINKWVIKGDMKLEHFGIKQMLGLLIGLLYEPEEWYLNEKTDKKEGITVCTSCWTLNNFQDFLDGI